jgi:hypothetical protein
MTHNFHFSEMSKISRHNKLHTQRPDKIEQLGYLLQIMGNIIMSSLQVECELNE